MTIIDDYIDYQEKYALEYGENTCVLMQVGHFYEAYAVDNEKEKSNNENIYRLSDILNIQLTRKNKSIKENSRGNPLMIGVNLFSIDKYIQLLLNNNYTTILIEQTTPPPEPDREVTGIYSPGTNIAHLSKGDTNNLMTIYIETNTKIGMNMNKGEILYIGMASIDVSIGNSTVYETFSKLDDKNLALDEAFRFIQTHDPKEIVVYLNNCHIAENEISKYLELHNRVVHFKSKVEPHIFNIQYQKTFLEKVYQNKGMLSVIEYLDLEFKTYGTLAFMLALEFAYKHNETIIKKMEKPIIWDENKYLILTNNSINQLNIVTHHSQANSAKFNSLFAVLNNTSTSIGKRKLKDTLLNPIINPTELQSRYDLIDMFISNNPETNEPYYKSFETHLNKIMDIERLHRKISLGLLQPADFVGLDISYENILQLSTIFPESMHDLKPPKEVFALFYEFIKDYKRQFDMDEICKYHLDKINNSFFNGGNHPEIDTIKNKIDNDLKLFDIIAEKLTHLIDSNQKGKFIHLDYNERDGHFLYITTKRLTLLKQKFKVIKHQPIKLNDQYSINPQDLEFKTYNKTNMKISNNLLKKMANDLRINRDKIGIVVREVYLKKLAEFDFKYSETLKVITKYIATLDFYKSAAKTAIKYGYKRPSIDLTHQHSFIETEELRHPIIERIQEDIEYVPNDIDIGDTGILLFGTNASGKSSLMKAIGLNIIMAQAGLFVSATKFTFKPYKYLFTRINNNDNIFKGESSFAVEMNELRSILKRATPNSMVLGDELCSGTESVSALSIFAASVDFLVSKKSSFIFATHLHELCKMDSIMALKDHIKLFHLKVIYDKERDKLIYNRKLTEGSGNAIYGLEVCKAMDMDRTFLEKATEIRQKLMGVSENILENKQSKYNAAVFVDHCMVCRAKAEDVHHIKFQCTADINNMIGHIQKDIKSNLVPLCKPCHIKVHNDNLRIHGYIQTNTGIDLNFEYIEEKENKKQKEARKKLNPDQIEDIKACLSKYNKLNQKTICLKLHTDYNIKISVATLSKINKGTY